MRVGRFVPPAIRPQPLDEEMLERLTGKHWAYVSSGKAAIYHCLRAMQVSGPIAVPVYACASVLVPIRALGLEPVFVDVDPVDLNLSFESFVSLAEQQKVGALIAPSLYGNPADLGRFEKFCREQGIFMIDDAAQSFGARLDGRCVGTFGDAGFFSFSPGKATAGHAGGFFWTREPYRFKRSAHPLIHRIKWWNFYWSRLKFYDTQSYGWLFRPIEILSNRLDKPSLWCDQVESFERPLLGGILHSLLNEQYAFRSEWHARFSRLLASTKAIRLIQAERGIAHPHKLVMVVDTPSMAVSFRKFFERSSIFSAMGYSPLIDSKVFPGATDISDRVVELAIDEDGRRMEFQCHILEKFIELSGQ